MVCLFLLAFVGASSAVAQASAPTEYQVKAAFLFHFGQFVDWPAQTFQDAGAPLTYCMLGKDPFHGALEASLNGKSIGPHPLRIRHLKQAQETAGCQVLFLGLEEKFIGETLERLQGLPVLTVGESPQFAQQGGMIGFSLQDNKVRFEINLGAAQQAGLKISSRLLTLAKTVIVAPATPKGT